MSRIRALALYIIGFLIGVAVLGLQTATTRPLTPHFGSDIYVWSALIAVTMMAMMVGYFVSGRLVDRYPRSDVLGLLVLASAAYLALVPWAMQLEVLPDPDPFFPGLRRSTLAWISSTVQPLPLGAIFAALLLVFPPFTLLSFFSPFCIRLLLEDAAFGGRTSGTVYAVTTLGNIVGVLGVSLGLMAFMGSQDIIFLFAGWLGACGIALIALKATAT